MGCAHPQFGAFAQKTSDSTAVPDMEHDLKTNDTARFRKKSANKYKELKIVFINIVP